MCRELHCLSLSLGVPLPVPLSGSSTARPILAPGGCCHARPGDTLLLCLIAPMKVLLGLALVGH